MGKSGIEKSGGLHSANQVTKTSSKLHYLTSNTGMVGDISAKSAMISCVGSKKAHPDTIQHPQHRKAQRLF